MAATDPSGINLRDPLQGFDIKVETFKNPEDNTGGSRLMGAFTSLMFKVVNQTETYLPLNSRIPRMLDGELIVVWSLEQGLIDLDVVTNTFGDNVATAFAKGRTALIPRQARFSISFKVNSADESTLTSGGASDTVFNVGNAGTTSSALTLYRLEFCRVDTMNFGVTAGRHVIANTWQGTAQNLSKV